MIEMIAERFIHMYANAHTWHWFTKNEPTHRVLEDFYSELRDLADEWVEYNQPNGSRIVIKCDDLTLNSKANPTAEITKFLKELELIIDKKSTSIFSTEKNVSLPLATEDVLIRTAQLCRKTLYRLSFTE